jgi:hypothetical protein
MPRAFSIFSTVVGEMVSITPRSTSVLASRRCVHLDLPFGGEELASARSFFSKPPPNLANT